MKRALVLLACLVAALPAAAPASGADPHVVVALIDTGINPYSPAFRDTSAQAQRPPSEYLPGYPADCETTPEEPTTACAVRLDLTLDATSYAEAYAADEQTWSAVIRGQLYYVPGTTIVGGVSFGAGGRRCPRRVGTAWTGEHRITFAPPAGALNTDPTDCPERVLLDDHGHGTMTASRAVGAPGSLAPSARVVVIEGLGGTSSAWAAAQPWIDVQSNSWGSLVPAPADTFNMRVFTAAAKKHLVVVASGNGLGFSGVAPTPTQLDGLGAPGVVLVGAHDNGRVTGWHGQPAHVVADAYAGMTAIHNTLETMRPDPVACCTSTSAPYAAGGAAAILREARRLLGETRTGVRTVVVGGEPTAVAAQGASGALPAGPLADGIFTLAEWKRVYMLTAQARPVEGAHDGLLHWLGEDEPTAPRFPEYGTADNPYCQFCWTTPLRWTDVASDEVAVANVGYGAINEHSSAAARAVLRGESPVPARPFEDAFFAVEDRTRRALFDPITGG